MVNIFVLSEQTLRKCYKIHHIEGK